MQTPFENGEPAPEKDIMLIRRQHGIEVVVHSDDPGDAVMKMLTVIEMLEEDDVQGYKRTPKQDDSDRRKEVARFIAGRKSAQKKRQSGT